MQNTLLTHILEDLQNPDLRALVNAGQDEFKVELQSAHIQLHEYPPFEFVDYPIFNFVNLNESAQLFEFLPNVLQFRVIDWCIRILSRFDKPNPKFVQFDLKGNHPFESESQMLAVASICGLDRKPQTLREALIRSGKNSVEGLNQVYESLIKNQ